MIPTTLEHPDNTFVEATLAQLSSEGRRKMNEMAEEFIRVCFHNLKKIVVSFKQDIEFLLDDFFVYYTLNCSLYKNASILL
jgi:hypothetical protein